MTLVDNNSAFVDDFSASIREAVSGQSNRISYRLDTERAYLSTSAPNAIRWAVDREYCNSPSLYEYQRSYQVVRDTFQLRCPICNRGGTGDCWGRSRSYLEDELLLEWSATNEQDTCPKCGLTRTELEADGLLKRINQLHLVCGMRSGKSVTAGLIGTYVEHRLYTLALGHERGLHGYFGLSLNDPLEMTFLASNETQSQDTIWAKYRAFRRDSPWFQRYVPWIKEQETKQQTPPGMEPWVYSESNRKIVNEHPDIFLIINSANTNSPGLRGRTRIFGAIDEIAYMLDGDGRLGADEIYRAVDNSLQTVRSRTKLHSRPSWLGLMCSVTSPRSREDKSMRLLREAPKIEGMLAYHYATWEFNPFEPRENFEDAYAKDPIGAERDFGARPPLTTHPLIQDVNRFRHMIIDPDLRPTATFTYPTFKEGGSDYIGIKLQDARLQRGQGRYVAFDAGKNFDAFAGACAHGEIMVDEETGTQRIITVFDWVVRILPPEGAEVYYDHVLDVVKKLTHKQPLVRTEFDHWNATYLIQQIRRVGPRAEEIGVKGDDYRRFRADAYNGLIRMLPPAAKDLDDTTDEWIMDPPYMDATSCALYEIEGLEEDPDTKKVYNPRKGQRRGWDSNDVAEVVVHAHKMVQEAGYTKKDDDRSRRAARKRSEGESATWLAGNSGGVYNVTRGRGAGYRNWHKSPGGRGW